LRVIVVSEHAPDEGDLSSLTKDTGASPARNVGLAALVGGVIGLALYVLSGSVPWSVGVAGLVVAAATYSNVGFFRQVEARKSLQDQGHGVERIQVDASSALNIEFMGDDGPAWVFFCDGGSALLLVGQWLLDDDSMPSLSFQLRRWSDDLEPIRFVDCGPRVALEEAPIRLEPNMQYGMIERFEATSETLQVDLERAFARQA
jgi:hypothetical protein